MSKGRTPESRESKNQPGSSPLNVAVIGSGAVGFSVLAALLESPIPTQITLYDISKSIAPEPVVPDLKPQTIAQLYDGLYSTIWDQLPRQFPPPKTHFTEKIAKRKAGTKRSVFHSNTFGGLTNYWGGTMLPLTQREVHDWPIPSEALLPYYRTISKLVGLSAKDDELNQYFNESFATRPAIEITEMLSRLDASVNAPSPQAHHQYRVVSGLNRIAIETRKDNPNACVYCGECMAGCFRSSVFSARPSIESFLKDDRVTKVEATVREIDLSRRTLVIRQGDSSTQTRSYDRIILSAGAIGTTEILMRSFQIEQGPVMTDNAVYVFPIVYLGGDADLHPSDQYLSQCNLIFGCIPTEKNQHFAQAQIYPNFDYLWRYNIPTVAWNLFRPIARRFRSRLFWARLYLHSDYSQSYALSLKHGDRLDIETSEANLNPKVVDDVMRSLKASVSRNGFWIPPVPPIRQKTNSHYGGTFPYGGPQIDIGPDNQVSNGVFVADSTTFTNSPAVSPTFGMMANAARITKNLLNHA